MAILSSNESPKDTGNTINTVNTTNQRSKAPAAALALKVAAGVTASLIAAGALGADLTIQIGAFGAPPKAGFTEQARNYGEVLVKQGDDGITRVSIGRYPTKTDARSALSRLQVAGYPDAYIANIASGDQTSLTQTRAQTPAQTSAQPTETIAAQTAVTPNTQQNSTPERRPTRTITNPATASSQRLPSGEQLVTPKRPDTSGVAKENSATQAGRFRLRTHDTQSGQTSDVRLEADGPAPEIVPGKTFKEIPVELRNNLVYLDGVPHIKEGDEFIPLDDAVDGKP